MEVSYPSLLFYLHRADHAGPLFLIPGLLIAMYVTGLSLLAEQKIEMKRYLLNKRREEGGWGL